MSFNPFRDDVTYNGKTLLRIKAMPRDVRRAAVFTSSVDVVNNPVNENTRLTLEHFIRKTQEFELKQTLVDRHFDEADDRFFSTLLSGDRDVSIMVEEGVSLVHIAHYFVTWARNYSPMWDFTK